MNARKRLGPEARGFTLVELLAVTTLVGLVLALLWPALAAARQRALRSTCMSNLRQIGAAFSFYQADHEGRYPCAGAAEFRDGNYGLYTLLTPYVPAWSVKSGANQGVDPRFTCPLYQRANKNSMDIRIGGFAYTHLSWGPTLPAGSTNPPTPYTDVRTVGGHPASVFVNDANAPRREARHWKSSVYGLLFDRNWDKYRTGQPAPGVPVPEAPPDADPYFGRPAHYPDFNVLFADLLAGSHRWNHRGGEINNDHAANVPVEFREDEYRLVE